MCSLQNDNIIVILSSRLATFPVNEICSKQTEMRILVSWKIDEFANQLKIILYEIHSTNGQRLNCRVLNGLIPNSYFNPSS